MKRFIKFWLKNGNWILEWLLAPGMMIFFLSVLYCAAIPEGRWTVALMAELFLAIWGISAFCAKVLRPTFAVTAFMWLGIMVLERAHLLEIVLWTVKGVGLFAVFVGGVILFTNFIELVVTELSRLTEEVRAELEESEAKQE